MPLSSTPRSESGFSSPIIRGTYGGEQASQDGLELIPFAGRAHEARYVKLLGHKLAHIGRMLRDAVYMAQVREISAEQLAIAPAVGGRGRSMRDGALKERWNRVWPLVLEVKRPALATKAEICRELLAGRR